MGMDGDVYTEINLELWKTGEVYRGFCVTIKKRGVKGGKYARL